MSLSDKSLLKWMSVWLCVCVCVDLVLSVGQPAASQSYWIEAGSWAGVAAWKDTKMVILTGAPIIINYYYYFFKDLNGLASKYISDLLTWYVPSWPLRSAHGALLVTARSQLVTNGDQAFAIGVSTLCNSSSSFKSLLKSFLYVQAFWDV